MSEKYKTLSRRVNEECFNRGNLSVADELLAADYVDHAAPPGLPAGVEGFKQLVAIYRTAFPDLHVTIEDQIAEGDKLATRFTASGTHQGELMGIAPSGKTIAVSGIAIERMVDNKIVEHWLVSDQLGMLQQLGVIPAQG